MDKTIEDRIDEKVKLIRELDSQLVMTQDLYQSMTSNYKDLYETNKANVNSQHINGFASLLKAMNDLFKQKGLLQNEINDLIDSDGIVINENEDELTGSKEDILKLIKNG